MGFTLDKVVPWGRSFDEYRGMFKLADEDLKKSILGCGDGPASFNCTLTRRGGKIVSADPIYQFSPDEIRKRIDETYDTVMQQMRINRDDYVWRSISSVEELGRIRMEAMDLFLSDYPTGLVEGRYVNAALPVLPFEDGEFCIALCSHLLFLYSGHLDLEFHYQSIKELCRVSVELRIFPLTELSGAKSRHLDGIVRQLENEKYSVRLEKTPYEFQKGSNEMIKICRGNL